MRHKTSYNYGAKPNRERLEKAYAIIKENPGIRMSLLSSMLGINYNTGMSMLVTMEHNGYILAEAPERGCKLWIFEW